MAVATNHFDELLNDLRMVQQLRETGDLNKALSLDAARHALSKIGKPARQGPFFTELKPHARPAPRPAAKIDVRAKVRQAVPELLNKAMSLFQDGKITATQVSAVEAKLHRLMAAVR